MVFLTYLFIKRITAKATIIEEREINCLKITPITERMMPLEMKGRCFFRNNLKIGNNHISLYLYESPEPHYGKTSPIQKGLIPSLADGGSDLSEEGLGFGLPLLQYKKDFYFPGTAEVQNSDNGLIEEWQKSYEFDLIERQQIDPHTKISAFSWVYPRLYNWTYLSPIRRKFLWLLNKIKGIYTALPNKSPLSPKFFKVKSHGYVRIRYKLNLNKMEIKITMDANQVEQKDLQAIFISNELGGRLFNYCLDCEGLKKDDEIGEWNRIHGNFIYFFAPTLKMGYCLTIPDGVKAFRGRELFLNHNINWSGVIFQLRPNLKEFTYRLRISSLKRLKEECLNDY